MISNRPYPVTESDLSHLEQWFIRYVHSFISADPLVQEAFTLKEKHSWRVRDEIRNIGLRLQLPADALRLAEAMALLHDIGRFEQFRRHRTFADGKSENHGTLGVRVLQKEKALAFLAEETQSLILKTVAYHNRMTVPANESPDCLYFTHLLRDADKLDIFHLLSDYYDAPPDKRNAAVGLELPDTPGISDDVLSCLQNGRMIEIEHVQSLNDFKLLQMAWIYDINFQPTFQFIYERRYIEIIRNTLPASEQIDRIYDRLSLDLRKRAEEGNTGLSPYAR